MSELRWIIGLIGLGLIAALYLWGRKRAGGRKDKSGRVEPLLDGSTPLERDSGASPAVRAERGWMQFPEPEIRREPVRAKESGPPGSAVKQEELRAETAPQKILVIYVRAASGEDFNGPDLRRALEGEGLSYGKYGAFHYLDEKGRSIFSVANMVEPGSFPEAEMESFSTVGITAFMVLPGPGGVDALARMVACCRRLASILGGEVLDERRCTLTNQGATHMKEELIEYLRQARLDPSGIGPVRG